MCTKIHDPRNVDGYLQAKFEIARKMIAAGIPIGSIEYFTGLQINDIEREAYESSLKNMRDYNNTIRGAEERGELKKAVNIARNLRRLGLSDEEISSSTGLSLEDIANLDNFKL